MAYIELRNITKSFFGVKALSDVSLSFEKGEVHAVVGENGAGKSTIMKILGGIYFADSGEIWIDGRKRNIDNVQDAINNGISVVYQELNLMPDLTVAENIFLYDLPVSRMTVEKNKLNQQAAQLLQEMELDIKPTEFVSMLNVSQQQMVEVAKALSRNSDIIIMDEPTAALNNKEVETLYRIIRKLKSQGKTVIYISHRLKEIFDLSDRVSVLRDGRYIGTYNTKDIDQKTLVEKMVGREISSFYTTADHEPGEVVLEVRNLCKEGYYKDISFKLRKGELLGIAGLMGCHREEIVKSIYGLMQPDSGEILLHGKPIRPKSPSEALKLHIGYVTEDRKNSGIFGLMTVRENLTISVLKVLSKFGIISGKAEQKMLDEYTKRMNMKYSNAFQRINSLSGGNQQKFLLARALARGCEVLIMLEPTRGIDVGAKAEIYAMLEELAKQGLAIIIVSSELPEIISICHRTLTIFQGTLTGDIPKEKMEEAFIMQCATGNTTCFEGRK
ncbi:MAG TPA: sugar ABC transporter ATP-binding protein [Clostridiaceae bacterium]|nr:sugar ABC transporter ATP-binding protein [Clostridiaceae bacterium]